MAKAGLDLQYAGDQQDEWQRSLTGWSCRMAVAARGEVRRRWRLLPLSRRWLMVCALPGLLLLGAWVHERGLDRRGRQEAPMAWTGPVWTPPSRPAAPQLPLVDWAPDRNACARAPSDHLLLPNDCYARIRVLTIRARTTGYTAYDHAVSHPAWADGIVSWHPDGRRRRVSAHPHGLATDWSQFPPGATFIRVPGYLDGGTDDPRSFRVVDDGCGAARRANRLGRQPVIDLRFIHRSSVIGGHKAWGSRELEVEVVFPAGFAVPDPLRCWVVSDEYRIYAPDGRRVG